MRDRNGKDLAIGYKLSADEHNYQEIVAATRLAKELGADLTINASDVEKI